MGDQGEGGGYRLYAIASAIELSVFSWISLMYSGAIERKQVAEYGRGGGGGAIVINAAFCSASGQISSKFSTNPHRSSESL